MNDTDATKQNFYLFLEVSDKLQAKGNTSELNFCSIVYWSVRLEII